MERYLRSIFPKDILIVFILTVALIIGRITLFHSYYFVYLLWNIFLALLPFMLSLVLLSYAKRNKLSTLVFIIGGIIWLLLLPNAPYIVTDLIHIGKGRGAAILFDTLLLFSSAWLGLLFFMHSLSHIEKIIVEKYGKRIAQIKIPSIIALVSIGVYIGRNLRFNSWDIFNPSLFEDTWLAFTHPVHFNQALLFIVPCFFFLCMIYFSWKTRQQ